MGLIPARAGNTIFSRFSTVPAWAHPRSRGEHEDFTPGSGKRLGSSPLARGTPAGCVKMGSSTGLIPARAGNTNLTISSTSTSRAHPRSRGEHNLRERAYERFLGSSPLARGTPVRVPPAFVGVGLIPARAGNTGSLAQLVAFQRAHPRSRGEHTLCFSMFASAPGSSPLARGTLQKPKPERNRDGLIPARAGNTHAVITDALVDRAHPRSRGEHNAQKAQQLKDQGSSPLARGTHRKIHDRLRREGLIPARAGNTQCR